MKYTLRLLVSALVLGSIGLILSGRALAQTPKTEETITTRFRVMVWNENQPASFTYKNAEKSIKVDGLSPSGRSKFFDYSGPLTMMLYPQVTAPKATANTAAASPQPELTPSAIASVVFPAGIKYPLVLLVPNKAGPYPYRGIVFDEDPTVFPFKSYLFVSFSATRVATSIGGDQFVLDPLQTHLLTSERKNLNLRMAISLENGSDWRIIKDDFYPNWPGFRTIFFLVDTVKEGRAHIEIRCLYEAQAGWEEALKPKK
jgi:hypothetical protein